MLQPSKAIVWVVAAMFVYPLVGNSTDNQWPDSLSQQEIAQITGNANANPGTGLSGAPAVVQPKYKFLFFHTQKDPNTTAMWNAFQSALNRVGDRAEGKEVNIETERDQTLRGWYKFGGSTTPLVLAIAPNGAMMGRFVQRLDEDQLVNVFGTPAEEASERAFQQGKMVLLCVQNESTRLNKQALQGVRAFKSDKRFNQMTEVVVLDPANPLEAPFMRDLGIAGSPTTAQTVFLTPPGIILAQFPGATTKEAFMAKLKEGGCGPSCQCLEKPASMANSKPLLTQFFGKIAQRFARKDIHRN